MSVASRFVRTALAVVLVALGGCGGGDSGGPDPEVAAFLEDSADGEQAAGLRAAIEQAVRDAASSCRAGSPCRLSGSIVVRGQAEFTTPGCSTLTSTVFGSAIMNASFTGSLQRAGRYRVRVSTGTMKVTTTTSSMTCEVPGSPPITIEAPPPTSVVVPSGTVTVTVNSDGRNLTVTGAVLDAPPPGCTGGTRFVGEVIGLSNPMITLNGSMSCNIAGATARVTSKVKLIGTL